MSSESDRGDPVDLVPVLESRDLTELTIARSLLEAHGIPSVVHGEENALLGPLRARSLLSSKPPAAARLMVREEQQADAVEVLRASDPPPFLDE